MLTKLEYELLEASFNKLATIAADGRKSVGLKVPGAACEFSAELVNQTAAALSMVGDEYNKQGLTKVPAGRKPLRAFEQFLKQQLFSLTSIVLLEYDRRAKKAETAQAQVRLKVYIVKLKDRVEIISGLLKKIEKELNK
jgi:hypothetical protein